MLSRLSRYISRLAIAAIAFGAAASCLSQANKNISEHPDSRVDIYGGYGYFHPINSGIDGHQYVDISSPNATASVTGYFNHYFGVQMEGGYFSGPCTLPYTCGFHGETVYTAQAGPVFRYPLGMFVPFIHALGGGERNDGPSLQMLKWGWGVTGGAGLDIVLPFFNHMIAVRPIQADFQYSQVVFGPLVLPAGEQGGFSEIDALKLSGGVVLRLGEIGDKEPVLLSCSVDQEAVHPGDMITVTASTTGLNPKHRTAYTWATTGGKVTPGGQTATIDTTGVAPGDYTITGHVMQGTKARQQAACSTAFMVKPFEPPSVSCTATPSTVESGTSVDISTTGTSPQNRPLTYSYTTTAGQVTSSGPTAKLSTAGLGAGPITVTCNTVDDLGQSATNTTQVTVTAPQTPVIPQTQSLCSLSFNRDKRRPVRVDNESKACLDDVALALNAKSDAKLVIVGNTSPDEQPEAAAERALNERQYLTQEKGVDAGRIELRVGDTSGRTVNNTLVPSGAVFNEASTTSFDEKTITRHGQAYGVPGAHVTHVRRHRRAAVAAAPAAAPQGP